MKTTATLPEFLNFVETQQITGAEIKSLGKSRFSFPLGVDIPHWSSGKGEYEMLHTNVPAGTPVVFTMTEEDLAKIENNPHDLTVLQEVLTNLDIYPFGHSGDFSKSDVSDLNQKFKKVSTINQDKNPQSKLDPLKNLAGDLATNNLGYSKRSKLIDHLADSMQMFKGKDGQLQPPSARQRQDIVASILQGLASAKVYTRLDNPSQAFLPSEPMVLINQNNTPMEVGPQTAIVLRTLKGKDGKADTVEASPLSTTLIGDNPDCTYVSQAASGAGLPESATFSVRALADHMQNPDIETGQALARA